MEVTIEHTDGTTVVDNFTFIEDVNVIGETRDVKVYYGEPHADTTEYDVFADARITEVTP